MCQVIITLCRSNFIFVCSISCTSSIMWTKIRGEYLLSFRLSTYSTEFSCYVHSTTPELQGGFTFVTLGLSLPQLTFPEVRLGSTYSKHGNSFFEVSRDTERQALYFCTSYTADTPCPKVVCDFDDRNLKVGALDILYLKRTNIRSDTIKIYRRTCLILYSTDF